MLNDVNLLMHNLESPTTLFNTNIKQLENLNWESISVNHIVLVLAMLSTLENLNVVAIYAFRLNGMPT
jgi:hypothetical protein